MVPLHGDRGSYDASCPTLVPPLSAALNLADCLVQVYDTVLAHEKALETCREKVEIAADEALNAALGLLRAELQGAGDQVGRGRALRGSAAMHQPCIDHASTMHRHHCAHVKADAGRRRPGRARK